MAARKGMPRCNHPMILQENDIKELTDAAKLIYKVTDLINESDEARTFAIFKIRVNSRKIYTNLEKVLNKAQKVAEKENIQCTPTAVVSADPNDCIGPLRETSA